MEASKTARRQSKLIPWYYHKFFQYTVGIILVLLILFLFSQVSNFLSPVIDFISILFVPFVLSMLFYYLLRPVVYFLEGLKIPRWGAILLIYLIATVVLVFFLAYIGPILFKQLSEMANISVDSIAIMRGKLEALMSKYFNLNLDDQIEQKLFEVVQQFTTLVSRNALDLIGYITHIAVVLGIIPFIVFYLLKDDEDFAAIFLRYVPEDFGMEVRKILAHVDETLSNYITGLIIISSCVGLMLFIGYQLIGLNYALMLSVMAIIFMTIPFLGPFLSLFPALFVAFSSEEPYMVLKVLTVFLVVQQVEANILSPQIIGQRLNIHPLAIILVLLAAGSLYGLIGLILATPVYAVLKVLFKSLYKIYRLNYSPWRKKTA